MKLLVYGSTGTIGRRLIAEALERGHQVTAAVRDRARLPEDADRLEIVTGDVLDPAAVSEAAKGHDAVVCAVGASPHARETDPSLYKRAAASLTTALRGLGADAPRLVVVGGAGSLAVAPGMRLVDADGFPAEYRDDALGQAEALDYYRSVKDVRWTYASPAAVIEPGSRTGQFRVGGDELLADEEGKSFISTEDYAVALLDELESRSFVGRRFTVAY